MFMQIALLMLFVLSSSNELSVPVLDGTSGIAYIEMAEDILQQGRSKSARKEAARCFVLAAFIDHSLERSAILGLVDIEENSNRRKKLLSILPPSLLLTRKVVSQVENIPPVASPEQIFNACKEIQKLRLQDKIQKVEGDETLIQLIQYASTVLSQRDRTTLVEGGKNSISQSLSEDTLRAELLLLGGTTRWSSAVLVDGNVPLWVDGHVDLAKIMGVDTSKYIHVDGVWVSP